MKVFTVIQEWFRQRRLEQLTRDLRTLTEKLYAIGEAQIVREKAIRLGDAQAQQVKWDDRLWLIDAKEKANEQVFFLDMCIVNLDRAHRLGPGKGTLAELFGPFTGLLGDKTPNAIVDLKSALHELRNTWSVVKSMPNVGTHVFAMHAFVRFSELSKLQVASVLSGALVVLGAVRMVFFYHAAAAQPVSVYWTLNDLVIQGVTVVPWVVLLGVSCEVLVRVFRTWVTPKILRYPAFTVASLVLVAIVSVSWFGYVMGTTEFKEFRKSRGDEVATVMDNTTLRRVHLIGTTVRTAVFLMATKGGEDSLATAEVAGYGRTLRCAASEFLFGWFECPRRQGNAGYQVLVMDRAQVVCHARGREQNVCEELRRETNPTASRVDERIDNNLRAIQQRQGDVEGRIIGYFDEKIATVEEHMDRHYNRIADRLPPLPATQTR